MAQIDVPVYIRTSVTGVHDLRTLGCFIKQEIGYEKNDRGTCIR